MFCTFEEKDDVLRFSKPLYWISNMLTTSNVVINFEEDNISIKKHDREKGVVIFMDFDPDKIFAEYDLKGEEKIPVGIFYLGKFANLLGLFGDETSVELGKVPLPSPEDNEDVEEAYQEAFIIESDDMDVKFLTDDPDDIDEVGSYNPSEAKWWATGKMDKRVIGKLKSASSALSEKDIVRIESGDSDQEVTFSITDVNLPTAFTMSVPMKEVVPGCESIIDKNVFQSVLNSTDQIATRCGKLVCEYKFKLNEACSTSVFIACQEGRMD